MEYSVRVTLVFERFIKVQAQDPSEAARLAEDHPDNQIDVSRIPALDGWELTDGCDTIVGRETEWGWEDVV